MTDPTKPLWKADRSVAEMILDNHIDPLTGDIKANHLSDLRDEIVRYCAMLRRGEVQPGQEELDDEALMALWLAASRHADQPQCVYPQMATLRAFYRVAFALGESVGGDNDDRSDLALDTPDQRAHHHPPSGD